MGNDNYGNYRGAFSLRKARRGLSYLTVYVEEHSCVSARVTTEAVPSIQRDSAAPDQTVLSSLCPQASLSNQPAICFKGSQGVSSFAYSPHCLGDALL